MAIIAKGACPFCGSAVYRYTSVFDPKITMFRCSNRRTCGAVMSFDNPIANKTGIAEPFFESRTQIEFDAKRKEEES